MKQSAVVIASLFAAVNASKAQEAAKARMEADLKGWLHNGLAFDKKFLKAVHGKPPFEVST